MYKGNKDVYCDVKYVTGSAMGKNLEEKKIQKVINEFICNDGLDVIDIIINNTTNGNATIAVIYKKL